VWTGGLDELDQPAAPADAAGTIVIGDVVSVRTVITNARRIASPQQKEIRHA
jgi:hypothetical protein